MSGTTNRSYTDQRARDERIQDINRKLYPEFFSMVIKNEKKKRKCLRCGVVHKTPSAHTRICGSCLETQQNVGVLGTWVVEGY